MARVALGCLLAANSALGFLTSGSYSSAIRVASRLHSSDSLILDFDDGWKQEFGGDSSKEPKLLDSEEGTPFPSMPLPEEIAREIAMDDIVFCERLPEAEKKKSGLFLPGKSNPSMHVGRIVSTGEGRIEESGYLRPNQGLKAGDLVFLKDPWGIGPRDEEYTDETGILRRFSYVRYNNIAGLLDSAVKQGEMGGADFKPGSD